MDVYGNVKELLAKDINLKQLLGLLENEDRSEKEETRSRSSSFTGQGKYLEVMASFIELIYWLTIESRKTYITLTDSQLAIFQAILYYIDSFVILLLI